MNTTSYFDLRGLGLADLSDLFTRTGSSLIGEGKITFDWLSNIFRASVPAALLSMTNTFDCGLSL
jgi:hypothetical protein